MNQESYVILSEAERFINTLPDCGFKVTFTCPEDAFRFQLNSKLTGETTQLFTIHNIAEPEYIDKVIEFIMYGLGYERKK